MKGGQTKRKGPGLPVGWTDVPALRHPLVLTALALALVACGDLDPCPGRRVPRNDTTPWAWVKVLDDAVCVGDDEGYVHCWGPPAVCEELEEPFASFDMENGLACGRPPDPRRAGIRSRGGELPLRMLDSNGRGASVSRRCV